MSSRIHPAASTGFARGVDAYERSRPGYPAEAVRWVAEHLGLGPSSRVLDLGAGTGKLTRELVKTGARVIAVEPVAEMRRVLARHLPEVEVLDGTAEAIPLPDAGVDAATVAQAFHWFDAQVALRELHRVLSPGAGLAVVFNVRDESVRWQSGLTELLRPLEGNTPRHRHGTWRAAIDAAQGFGRAREAAFAFGPPTTIDLVVDRVASMSFVAAADEVDRHRLLEAVRAMLRTEPELAGRATFPFPYRTECLAVERIGPRGRPG